MELPKISRAIGLYISLFAALLATLAYVFSSVSEREKARRAEESLVIARIEMEQELRTISEQSKKYSELLDQLVSTQKNTAGVDKSEVQGQLLGLKQTTDGIKSDLAVTQSQMSALTGAIGNNPEKLLSVPLLRKDVDDLKGSTQREIDSLREEMGRTYELNKWLIGLILAAVIGTVINNLLQAKAEARNRYRSTFE